MGEQIKKGCCNIPSCSCNYGIYTIGNNFDISDYTGMTPRLEAELNAFDARIKEFEEKQGGM